MNEKQISRENKDWIQGYDAGYREGSAEGYKQGLRDAARQSETNKKPPEA